jgi:hypothetical protein
MEGGLVRRVVRLAAATLVLAAAVAGAGGAAARSGHYWKGCGTRLAGDPPTLVISTKAHSVRCKIARRVGRQYAVKEDRHPLGFTCGEPQPDRSGEAQKGTCRREGAAVRVSFGI